MRIVRCRKHGMNDEAETRPEHGGKAARPAGGERLAEKESHVRSRREDQEKTGRGEGDKDFGGGQERHSAGRSSISLKLWRRLFAM
jgi:hypothetical protein